MKTFEILKHLVILVSLITLVTSNSHKVKIEPNSKVIVNIENVIREKHLFIIAAEKNSMLLVLPDDTDNKVTFISNSSLLNQIKSYHIAFNNDTLSQDVSFTLQFSNEINARGNLTIAFYTTSNLNNMDTSLLSQNDAASRQPFTFKSIESIESTYLEGFDYLLLKIDQESLFVVTFDSTIVDIEKTKIQFSFSAPNEDKITKEDFSTRIDLPYFIKRIGNSYFIIDSNQIRTANKFDKYFTWISLSFIGGKNSSKHQVILENIVISDESEKNAEDIQLSYEKGVIKYFDIRPRKYRESELVNYITINPYPLNNFKESIDIFISYDKPIIKRPVREEEEYQLVKEGFPESIYLNLDKYLSSGRVFLSFFRHSPTNSSKEDKGEIVNFRIKINFINLPTTSVNISSSFSASFYWNEETNDYNNYRYVFRTPDDGEYAYLGLKGKGPENKFGCYYRIKSDIDYASIETQNDITKTTDVVSNSIMIMKRTKNQIDLIASYSSDVSNIYVSLVSTPSAEGVFNYKINKVNAVNLFKNMEITFTPEYDLTESYKIFIFSNSKSFLTIGEVTMTVEANLPFKLISSSEEKIKRNKKFKLKVENDAPVIILVSNTLNVKPDTSLSNPIDLSITGEKINTTLLYSLDSYIDDFRQISIDAFNGVITLAHFQVIDDETVDGEEGIFNYFDIEHINSRRTKSSSYYISNLNNYVIKYEEGKAIRYKKFIVIRAAYIGTTKTNGESSIRVQINKVNISTYENSEDKTKMNIIDFSKSNYFRHDTSSTETSKIVSVYNYSNQSCLIVNNSYTSSIKKSLNDLWKKERHSLIVCPKGTTGVKYYNDSSVSHEETSTHVKDFTMKNNQITIDVSDNIFPNSKYYLVSEINTLPMTILQIQKLGQVTLQSLEVIIADDKDKRTKVVTGSVKLENNSTTNIKLYAHDQENKDRWWSYDLIQIETITINSEVQENSIVFIILIVIFSIISLIGIILIIKFFLNRRKLNEERNSLLQAN